MTILYVSSGISLGLVLLGWLFLKPDRFNSQMSSSWLDEHCPDYTRARWNR